MQCPNCEAENQDDAKFCDECGFPLSGAIARAAGAASPTGGASTGRSSMPTAQQPQPKTRSSAVAESQPASERFTPEVRESALQPQINDSAPITIEVPTETKKESASTADPLTDGLETESASMPTEVLEPNEYESWPLDRAFTPSEDFIVSEMDEEEFVPVEHGRKDKKRSRKAERRASESTVQMPRTENGKATPKRDFMADTGKKKRPGAKIVVGIVVALVLVAAAAGAGFALGLFGGVVVPDVKGMTESDARSTLESEGFTVRATQVKSDDTEGLVLLMDPGAGSRAQEGSEIVIHVATARYIPEIVGKSRDEASALLAEAGYENVRVETEKSNDEENIVLSVKPDAGTRAKSSMEVVVTVSEAYRVPDISGLDIEAARQAIRDAGLTPEAVYVDTDQYVDGTIIGTTPESGAKASQGDYVTISIARTRGIELESLTESLLAPGKTVTIGGYDYDIESLDYVNYEGDDTVSFSATGRPKITFFGETLYASSSQDIEGTVVWSEDNEVVSIS